MLKYYIFAFLKANLITSLVFLLVWLLGAWEIYPEWHFKFWLVVNAYFQLDKPSEYAMKMMEDNWTWIRITQHKKWYDRYLDDGVKKEIKNVY